MSDRILPPHHFELIKANHHVSAFECELHYLTMYLRTTALDEHQKNIMRTYICIDEAARREKAVIGYFSLRGSAFKLGDESIPVIEIAFLARDVKRKPEKWGDKLLVEALRMCAESAHRVGAIGVQLEYSTAQNDRAYELYTEFGFIGHPTLDSKKYLYMPTSALPPAG